MRQQLKQALVSGLFEGFFVVLGVILALGANQWREQRANRQRAEAALSAVLNEIDSNKRALQESFDYHSQSLTMIRERKQAGTPLNPGDFPKGFIGPAPVLEVAWEAANVTGALERLDLEVLISLGKLYAEQSHYVHQSKASGDLLYADLYQSGPGGVVDGSNDLTSLIGTFWYTEQKLVSTYADTFDEVEALRKAGNALR